MKEAMVVRTSNGLVAATSIDTEILASFKFGKAVRVSLVNQSERSLQHHRLYFGGLIGLIKDYWEPQTGLVNSVEVRTAAQFCSYLQRKGVALTNEQSAALQQDYLQDLSKRRAGKLISPTPASTDEIHQWIKIECGLFYVIRLPNGDMQRNAKSISFGKMDQAEFNKFYKAAFGVAWRFVLSQPFSNEAEAENAINRMLEMAA